MKRWTLYTFLLITLQACSSQPVINNNADCSLTPQQATATPPDPGSQPLQWGGIIIEAQNFNEITEVEILAYPLDTEGRPDTGATSVGRFIAKQAGYLETKDYATGRQVTVTGKFSEIRKGEVAKASYQFPVLICDEISLWPVVSERKIQPRIHFGFGASSGGRSYGGIGIGIGL
ncbi:MAG: Slp family lipoprotein [Candidatus Thiodiazotropha sp. (ex Ustalcina ferruginea)]|nr:Slp family lipoprotein [Candidatus Thiodiazotropha sp. (ex Ustalcina ferruginea)]